MEEAHLPDTRTTPTIETIPSFAKRVRSRNSHLKPTLADHSSPIVCVSSLMVEEIKRIIKTSEIMKYVATVHQQSQ